MIIRMLTVVVVAAVILGAAAGAGETQGKTLSLLTWNIPVYKEKIDGWIADFKSTVIAPCALMSRAVTALLSRR